MHPGEFTKERLADVADAIRGAYPDDPAVNPTLAAQWAYAIAFAEDALAGVGDLDGLGRLVDGVLSVRSLDARLTGYELKGSDLDDARTFVYARVLVRERALRAAAPPPDAFDFAPPCAGSVLGDDMCDRVLGQLERVFKDAGLPNPLPRWGT